MEILLLVFLCVLAGSEVTSGAGNEPKVIRVEEGSDVTLPCSLSTKQDINFEKFEWKKDQKQVFSYDAGVHSNNGLEGQDQQFIGRVDYYKDKLTSGDASITIRKTTEDDGGNYTCGFPEIPGENKVTVLVVVGAPGPTGTTGGQEPTVITVKEGSDVTLPCSLSTKEDITKKKFEWKKDGRRQVFLYDEGDHSNIANTGQDRQFRGEVQHFPDKLKSGVASILIRNARLVENGNYTCEFPDLQPSQIFHIQLIVYVKAPPPSVRRRDQEKFRALLQCDVLGAFPKPEVHWENGAGNKLPAEEPVVTEGRGLYYITLLTTVIRTDTYRCVVTQKEIKHQTHDEIDVSIGLTGGEVAGIVIGVLLLLVAGVAVVVYRWGYRIKNCFKNVKAPKPSVWTFLHTHISAGLHGEVRGVFPKPELVWKDSKGNKLPAVEQVTERGGHYDVILKTVVLKTGRYRCVVTQEEHQTTADIDVYLCGITGTTGGRAQKVSVEEGSDAILPCSLSTKDITSQKFEWSKGHLQVFLYDGVDRQQDKKFKGRVSFFPDELKSGNAFIIIRDTKMADSGHYTCEFPDLQTSQMFYIDLDVEPTVIRVEVGSDITLPCSLSTKDITSQKFEWKKDGRQQVFLYDAGRDSVNTHQDEQFKGRVKHFPDELKSGDASIIISNMNLADSGRYSCIFPGLQPSQIFYIQLDVYEKTIKLEQGSDIILTCSLSTKDITSQKFVWKQDGLHQVFLYDGKDRVNTGQDEQFKGRVQHDPDKLKSGDASITISNAKWDDSGRYTCEFPDLHPSKIFPIQLVVAEPKFWNLRRDQDPTKRIAASKSFSSIGETVATAAKETKSLPSSGYELTEVRTERAGGADEEVSIPLMSLSGDQPTTADTRV